MRARRTWYQVLQVDPYAEPEVIEAAYRRLAKKYHPDVAASADAGERMKEITAAYAVLRDPRQRAAYDRELLRVRDQDPPLDDIQVDAPAAGEGFLACHRHRAAAVATCGDCGVGLCGTCVDRFRPPTCPGCVLAWAAQRRWEILPPAIWFGGVFAVWVLLMSNALTSPQVWGYPSFSTYGWMLLGAYLIASLPSGFRAVGVLNVRDGEDVALSVLAAAVLGPIIAPFRMCKVYFDLRKVSQMERVARAAG